MSDSIDLMLPSAEQDAILASSPQKIERKVTIFSPDYVRKLLLSWIDKKADAVLFGPGR